MAKYISSLYSFSSLLNDFEEYIEENYPYLSSGRQGHLFKIICKEYDSGMIADITDNIGYIKANID